MNNGTGGSAHKVLTGDALAMLRTLPDQSVHCCVTSPPYWGLRDYGTGDAQIGLEESPDAYVGRLVAVFDEVRRVLRDDGTLWLNLGDTYAANRDYQVVDNKHRDVGNNGPMVVPAGLKPKDLVGIPWRVAFALQSAGWWLRSDIIWAKPSPMPESVRDRPTKAHEYMFLLSKAERYYYDADAIREKSIKGAAGSTFTNGKTGINGMGRVGQGERSDDTAGRNRRSVWTIATRPYPEAHFAVFPPALVEPCILAGTSARGVCPACGAPWVRVVERESMEIATSAKGQAKHDQGLRTSTSGTMIKPPTSTTTGWNPSCFCDANDPIPATVLDPFAGSGTTLAVAIEHKRAAIGIELNPEYVELIYKRLGKVQPTLFALTI